MKKRIYVILILLFLGCATAGKDFSTQNLNNIQLNITTKEQIKNWFGKPFQQTTKAKSNFESLLYIYVYAEGRATGFNQAKAKARALVVEFTNQVVNGYDYVSAFKEDIRQIDFDMRYKLKINTSTMAEAKQLLGEPNGKALIPTNIIIENKTSLESEPQKTYQVWLYHYSGGTKKEAGLNITTSKTLKLYFNKIDILVDLYFREKK